MKNLKPLAPVLLSLVLFPACAKKKAADPQPVSVTAGLPGEYDGACTETARHQSQVTSYTFDNADNLTQATVSYNDARCADSAFGQTVKSHYKLGAQTPTANVFQLDVAAVEVRVVPFSQRLADEWSRNRFCNISDWHEGESKIVYQPETCGLGVQLNVPSYTLLKFVDTNKIELGMPNPANRNEDGLAPERRYSAIDESVVYVRKGTQTTQPNEPGHNGPSPEVRCPLMAGHQYACESRGEEPFSGRDLSVTANEIPDGSEFLLDLARPGENMISQRYEANGQNRTSQEGSFRKDVTDSCFRGELISKTVITRQGDAGAKSIERRFRVAGNGDLLIDTTTIDANGSRNDVRTQCRALR